jgi:hypothetical protein
MKLKVRLESCAKRTKMNTDSKMGTISMMLSLILLISSCQKRQECAVIENNSYKGYGIFYYENHFQDFFTELHFIPVCTGKDDLLHLKNLNPQVGLNFYCDFEDSFLRAIAMHSKIISDESGFESYLTPVYIEFEEGLDYQEILEKTKEKPEFTNLHIPLNKGDTLLVRYLISQTSLLSSLIQINHIEFFSFVEE